MSDIKAGSVFGYYTVLKEDVGYIRRKWICRCKCGNIKSVIGYNLKNGNSKSCGCYARSLHRKHGLYLHPLYNVWINIRERCKNKNNAGWKHYGGRGIFVCEEWDKSFMSFYNWAINSGYESGLYIDRTNNDDGYYPENCRFLNARDSALNHRPLLCTNKTGYAGVSFESQTKKYRAQMVVNNKHHSLGRYTTKEAAAEARNQFIIKNHLEDQYKLAEIVI